MVVTFRSYCTINGYGWLASGDYLSNDTFIVMPYLELNRLVYDVNQCTFILLIHTYVSLSNREKEEKNYRITF
jgi:hypothetical protein